MGKLASHRALSKTGVKTKKSVGAYGSRRDTPARSAKQVTRRENRLNNGRVASALEEAAAERERLDKLIAAQRKTPAIGPTPGALYVQQNAEPEPEPEPEPVRPPERHRFEPYEGEPREGYTIGQSRSLIRQGYAVQNVMRRTGIGWKWLEDLAIGPDGRLMSAE